jgi:HPt (histidine-containing phosphotransfer) domain-containing protein
VSHNWPLILSGGFSRLRYFSPAEKLNALPERLTSADCSLVPKTTFASGRQTFLDRVGGDIGLARELSVGFIAESPMLIARMRAAFQTDDCDSLRRAAHEYKGSVWIFSLETAVSLASDIELHSAVGNLEEAGKNRSILEGYAHYSCVLIDAMAGDTVYAS